MSGILQTLFGKKRTRGISECIVRTLGIAMDDDRDPFLMDSASECGDKQFNDVFLLDSELESPSSPPKPRPIERMAVQSPVRPPPPPPPVAPPPPKKAPESPLQPVHQKPRLDSSSPAALESSIVAYLDHSIRCVSRDFLLELQAELDRPLSSDPEIDVFLTELSSSVRAIVVESVARSPPELGVDSIHLLFGDALRLPPTTSFKAAAPRSRCSAQVIEDARKEFVASCEDAWGRCRAAAQGGQPAGVARRRSDFESAASVLDEFERVAEEMSQFIEDRMANLKRRQTRLRERQIAVTELPRADAEGDNAREIVAVIAQSAKERAGRSCEAFRNQIAELSQEIAAMSNMLDIRIHEFLRVMKLWTVRAKPIRRYDDHLAFTSNRFELSGIE
jgi:hypothetical protein